MALRREYMAVLITLFSLLPLLFVPTTATTDQQLRSDHHHHHHQEKEGHISIYVSESGLDFAKDLLIQKALSLMIPLHLSDFEKKVKIPLVGSVHLALSDIQIFEADIPSTSSVVDTAVEENAVVLDVSGATADLSMNWSYTYSALFVRISDHGTASVKVEDMDVRLTVSLIERYGSLTVSVLESDCNVKSLKIDINGGASWLYQGVVDAFQKKITAAVENTVSTKIKEKMEKLQSLLQSIPREKKIDDFASVNLTFTGEPILGDSSVEVEINGLLIPNDNAASDSEFYLRRSRPSFFFGGLERMVKISLEDKVFNSATLVYFNAERMHLVMDKTYNQSILNTSFWKPIFPKLYRQYPDDGMKLNMSVTSPPAVMITEKGIHATIHLDTTVDVLDFEDVIPVACISSVLSASCSAEILENNLAGSLRLVDFNASLKWSEFGNLHPNDVQTAMSTILEAVFLPYVNARLKRGFPLPIPHNFSIKGTEILFTESRATVCIDVNSYI